MSFKESKVYAIVNQKCPVCHEGDLFKHKNPYRLKHLFVMHEKCSVCGFRFEPETGFYYGAMYTAYGFSVGISIALYVAWYFLKGQVPIVPYLLLNAFILLILFPLTFRLSRSVWVNLLFHYRPGPYDPDKH